MQIGGAVVSAGYSSRPDLFNVRVQKAREAASAANQEFVAAAQSAGQTPHADFSRVSYAQIALHLGAADGVVYTTDIKRVADLALRDVANRLGDLTGGAKFGDGTFRIDSSGTLEASGTGGAAFRDLLQRDPTLAKDLREAIILQQQAVAADANSLYAAAYQQAYMTGGATAAAEVATRYGQARAPDISLRFGGPGDIQALFDGRDRAGYLSDVAQLLGMRRGGLIDVRT